MLVLKVSPKFAIEISLFQTLALPTTEILVIVINLDCITTVMRSSNWLITKSSAHSLEALHQSFIFQQAELTSRLVEDNLIFWWLMKSSRPSAQGDGI